MARANYRFINETNNQILAERATMARSFFTRLKGLLGTRSLEQGAGLLIEPCKSIHMFVMHYSIDVVFLDKSYSVVGLVQDIRPGKMSKVFSKARSALELPSGTIAATGTALGDRLACERAEGQ